MRRVAVLGCGGAGKTILARRLGVVLGIDVIHADFLRHDRDGATVSEDEWRARHAAVIRRESWVFDAMKLSLLDERLRAADTAVFLDLPRRTCLLGILRRRLRYRGRIDSELGVADCINIEFLVWVWGFRRDYRPRVLELLERHESEIDVVILRSRRDVREFVRGVAARHSPESAAGSSVSTSRFGALIDHASRRRSRRASSIASSRTSGAGL